MEIFIGLIDFKNGGSMISGAHVSEEKAFKAGQKGFDDMRKDYKDNVIGWDVVMVELDEEK